MKAIDNQNKSIKEREVLAIELLGIINSLPNYQDICRDLSEVDKIICEILLSQDSKEPNQPHDKKFLESLRSKKEDFSSKIENYLHDSRHLAQLEKILTQETIQLLQILKSKYHEICQVDSIEELVKIINNDSGVTDLYKKIEEKQALKLLGLDSFFKLSILIKGGIHNVPFASDLRDKCLAHVAEGCSEAFKYLSFRYDAKSSMYETSEVTLNKHTVKSSIDCTPNISYLMTKPPMHDRRSRTSLFISSKKQRETEEIKKTCYLEEKKEDYKQWIRHAFGSILFSVLTKTEEYFSGITQSGGNLDSDNSELLEAKKKLSKLSKEILHRYIPNEGSSASSPELEEIARNENFFLILLYLGIDVKMLLNQNVDLFQGTNKRTYEEFMRVLIESQNNLERERPQVVDAVEVVIVPQEMSAKSIEALQAQLSLTINRAENAEDLLATAKAEAAKAKAEAAKAEAATAIAEAAKAKAEADLAKAQGQAGRAADSTFMSSQRNTVSATNSDSSEELPLFPTVPTETPSFPSDQERQLEDSNAALFPTVPIDIPSLHHQFREDN